MTEDSTGGTNAGCAGGGSFSAAFSDDLGGWTTSADRYTTFAIWHLDMQGMSFPDGFLRVTIFVNDKSGPGSGGNIKLTHTQTFNPGGPLPSLSGDTSGISLPAVGNSVTIDGNSQVFQDGYMRIDMSGCAVYTTDLQITDIKWVETIAGTIHDLWETVQRIKRVRINDGYVYNICTE